MIFRAEVSEQDAIAMYLTVRQWVMSPGAFVFVNNRATWIDASCPLLTDSLSVPAKSSTVGIVSGVLVTLLLCALIALAVVCIIVFLIWMKSKRCKRDESAKPQQTVTYKKKPPQDGYEYLDIADQKANDNKSTRKSELDDSNMYEFPEPATTKQKTSMNKKNKQNTKQGTSHQKVHLKSKPAATANASKEKKHAGTENAGWKQTDNVKTLPTTTSETTKPIKQSTSATSPTAQAANKTAVNVNVHKIDPLTATPQQTNEPAPPPPPPQDNTPFPQVKNIPPQKTHTFPTPQLSHPPPPANNPHPKVDAATLKNGKQ